MLTILRFSDSFKTVGIISYMFGLHRVMSGFKVKYKIRLIFFFFFYSAAFVCLVNRSCELEYRYFALWWSDV